MRTSEQTGELYAALIAAADRLENPKASAKADTGQFSYRYAPLPEIVDIVRAALNEQGLAALQEVVTDKPGVIGVTTRIVHSSGEWIELGPFVLPAGNSPQQAGSAITYARRYSLTAALLLAADEDDDGAKASEGPSRHRSRNGEGESGSKGPSEPTSPEAAGGESDEGGPTAHDVAGSVEEQPTLSGQCDHDFQPVLRKDLADKGWRACTKCGRTQSPAEAART